MPRPVKIRPSYKNDAGYLVRLAEAIEKDERLPFDERREVLAHLSAVITLLMRANLAQKAG